MNKIFLLIPVILLITNINLIAQKKSKKQLRSIAKAKADDLSFYNHIFEEDDKDFQITEAPEKWANESSVVLCQKYHLYTSTEYSVRGIVRKRILLQDKIAVEELSEFYFQENETIQATLIKKNGEKRVIDLSDAVEVETNVPSVYGSGFQSSRYSKVAIADLEPGDILDYYTVFSERMRYSSSFFLLLNNSYPILNQEYIFDVGGNWGFYQKSFNQAPKITKSSERVTSFKTGENRSGYSRYILKDKDRETREVERWNYPYLNEPLLKVMLIPPSFDNFFDHDININDVDIFDVSRRYLNSASYHYLILSYVKRIKKEIAVRKIPKSDIEQLCTQAFYHVREKFLESYVTEPDFGKSSSRTMEQYKGGLVEAEMRDVFFSVLYTSILDDFDIKSFAVIAVPRSLGGIDKVMTDQEVIYGAYVPEIDAYFWPPNNFHNHTDTYTAFEGASAYLIRHREVVQTNIRANEPKRVTLPTSDYQKNKSVTKMDIEIGESMDLLNFKNKVTIDGHLKDYVSLRFMVYDFEFMKKDKKEIFNTKISDVATKSSRKKVKERAAATKDKMESEFKEKQKEIIENWFTDDHKIKDFVSYKLLHSGRTPDHPKLELEAEYTSEEFIAKAGKNYIFEAGSLIGGQVALKEKEIEERYNDVEFGMAKEYVNEIKITIPEGYKADGLDKLNLTVDHPMCSFISTASQVGNQLKIKTVKSYKKSTIDKKDWAKLVEMLEAAYDFSQTKIVLKK